MRHRFWLWVTDPIAEGALLPWWAMVIRALLFPLDFLYWRMSKSRGYQMESDTWVVEGVRMSGRSVRMLAEAKGDIYRVTGLGHSILFERVIFTEDLTK